VLFRNALGIDPSGAALVALTGITRPDVVHMHDTVVAFGYRAARAITRRAALVVTLHDFSAFTGGCLFPGDCVRYETGCGGCPQTGNWPLSLPIDTTARTWQANRQLAREARVAYVSPSRFVANLAQRGALTAVDVTVIPNPVDTEVFTPSEREAARAARGFSSTDRVLLFVAFDVTDPRKGFADLAYAFLRLAQADEHVRLVVAGNLARLPEQLRPFANRVQLRGPVANPADLARLYSASDLLVVPSYRDNAPCTISESLACGTPVVAYDTGGISEMFVDGEHGVLVSERSSDALETALGRALVSQVGQGTRIGCRTFAERRYSRVSFVAEHERLYAELLER
jgi:glycosyltransferase involved in cell wall biosynthesis